MSNPIPSLDLQLFVTGSEEERSKFVQDLGKTFRETGFAAIYNHSISQDLIDSFFSEVEAFFAQADEIKKKYCIDGLAGQRGYTPFGVEKAKQSKVADLKEFWQFGQTVEGEDVIKSEYPDNVVVDERPEFNKFGRQLYVAFEECGAQLLKAIAIYLGLDENYFNNKIHNGNSILRAIHYPPISSEPASAIRAEQHEDINLITLLVGASAEGLELLGTDDQWKAINANAGEIVINVGDMLQRLTNNVLKSTTHRVVNPPKEKWHLDRLSIPFFLHPRSEMDLTCLEDCVDEDNALHYEPITAGDYLYERLVEIGLAQPKKT